MHLPETQQQARAQKDLRNLAQRDLRKRQGAPIALLIEERVDRLAPEARRLQFVGISNRSRSNRQGEEVDLLLPSYRHLEGLQPLKREPRKLVCPESLRLLGEGEKAVCLFDAVWRGVTQQLRARGRWDERERRGASARRSGWAVPAREARERC